MLYICVCVCRAGGGEDLTSGLVLQPGAGRALGPAEGCAGGRAAWRRGRGGAGGRQGEREGEREGETEGGRSLRAQAEPPFPFPGRRAPSAFSCGGGRWPRGAAAGGAGPGTEERLNFLEVEEPR